MNLGLSYYKYGAPPEVTGSPDAIHSLPAGRAGEIRVWAGYA